MINVYITKENDRYEIGAPNEKEFFFDAHGRTIYEAIGAFVISNRETLKINFKIDNKNETIS